VRIAYVARHGQIASNDDEGAIAYALAVLGHDVLLLGEDDTHGVVAADADVVLCHHWQNVGLLSCLRAVRVCWCFDRIADPDPSLRLRSRRRVAWARTMAQVADVFALTDGDWVRSEGGANLVHLPQGADERVIGQGTCQGKAWGVLLTGIGHGGGHRREEFVACLARHLGSQMRHVERGVHGRALADLIALAEIVIAPDAPVGPYYASNRIWLTLGYGGFLLHPWTEYLAGCYRGGEEIVWYRSREEMLALIADYGRRPEDRQRIALAGLERTRREHLYRHRVERLMALVEEE
jgi:hypothetical protein